MTQKVVVIYSGGMDSFTVLNKALQQGHEVYALSFDYGQRHVKELKVAAQVCEKLGVPHKIVDISKSSSHSLPSIFNFSIPTFSTARIQFFLTYLYLLSSPPPPPPPPHPPPLCLPSSLPHVCLCISFVP